jgi:hypothetical protein
MIGWRATAAVPLLLVADDIASPLMIDLIRDVLR